MNLTLNQPIVLLGVAICAAYVGIVLVASLLPDRFRDAIYNINKTDVLSSSGNVLRVRHGQLLPGSSPYLIKIGGMVPPEVEGWLEVDPDSAVLLEIDNEFTRTVCGQYDVLRKFEKIRGIVDLRIQRRTKTLRAITRDGIPVRVESQLEFRVRPNDSKAIQDALYPLTVQEDGMVTNWADLMTTLGTGEIENLLTRYRLDELTQIRIVSQGESMAGVSVRQEIQTEAETIATDVLKRYGGELVGLRMKSFMFDQDEVQGVPKQRLESWQTYWDNRAELERLKGAKEAVRKILTAQSNSELEFIRKIALGLSNMRGQDIDPVVWFRVVACMERTVIQFQSYRFPPQDLMVMFKELKGMIDSTGAKGKEHSFPQSSDSQASPPVVVTDQARVSVDSLELSSVTDTLPIILPTQPVNVESLPYELKTIDDKIARFSITLKYEVLDQQLATTFVRDQIASMHLQPLRIPTEFVKWVIDYFLQLELEPLVRRMISHLTYSEFLQNTKRLERENRNEINVPTHRVGITVLSSKFQDLGDV